MDVLKVNASASKEQKERYKTSCVFCSILTCKEADTNDSALLPVSRSDNSGAHRRKPARDGMPYQQQQSCGTDNSRNSGTGSRGKRVGSTNYMRVRSPNCSHCKKPFVPEKLHSHMQSCKALKGRRVDDNSMPSLACRRDTQGEHKFPTKAVTGYLTY